MGSRLLRYSFMGAAYFGGSRYQAVEDSGLFHSVSGLESPSESFVRVHVA